MASNNNNNEDINNNNSSSSSNNNNNNNNPQNQGQMPFWDFIQSLDPNRSHGAGEGVDHARAGASFGGFGAFPFGAQGFNPWAGHRGPWGGPWGGSWYEPWGESPWGRGGRRRGRHGHGRRHGRGGQGSDRDEELEEADFDMDESSPETLREDETSFPPPPPPPAGGPFPPPPPPAGGPFPPPPPPGEDPHHHSGPAHPFSHPAFAHHRGHHHPGGHPGGPGPFRRGGRCGRGGSRGRHGPPPPPPEYNGPFDLRPLMHALSGHPFAQNLREYIEQARGAVQGNEREEAGEQDDTFAPPVDIFNTEKSYVLHISLPGAVKEDIGVNWDADRSQLNVAGVVYRPGNEDFLQSLTSSERKVGMFERSIKLPPPGADAKEEVDGFSITARMENGILIVTVPKLEKEWTEIHKVDVE